eukprot:TRINITY_DN67468_c4_g2_i2.p1 TRINITY_DN67468_c4_g2~~TRINITY_DN67468_c4_g2_i2.p1  ORF type:complete len:107 (-),score=19.97 TRINITY_DN67468_c4_g2_i2:27-347(-)
MISGGGAAGPSASTITNLFRLEQLDIDVVVRGRQQHLSLERHDAALLRSTQRAHESFEDVSGLLKQDAELDDHHAVIARLAQTLHLAHQLLNLLVHVHLRSASVAV